MTAHTSSFDTPASKLPQEGMGVPDMFGAYSRDRFDVLFDIIVGLLVLERFRVGHSM